MTKRTAIDWLLLGRYATLVSLASLIPVPVLDWAMENYFRRRMVRAIASRHDAVLPSGALAKLGNEPFPGCLGCFGLVVLWPIRKLLRTVLFVWQAKVLADVVSDVLHRGLLLEDAFEVGWLPGKVDEVHAAMTEARVKVDTRPLESNIRGVFLDRRHTWSGVIREAASVARGRERQTRRAALADAADRDSLGEDADAISVAMEAAIRGSGLVPELLYWFRAEMGAPPRISSAVDGVLEVAEVLPPDVPEGIGTGTSTALVVVEDAEEVLRSRDGDGHE